MISAAFYHALSGPEKWRKGNGLRPRGGGGGAVSSLHNLPHLWGRGTAIAVEGVLAKVTLTVLNQYPQPRCGHPPTHEGKATHCILSRLRLLTNPVRLPPQRGGVS